MYVTKPYEFIRFGAMDVTKPYKFIGFGAQEGLLRPHPWTDGPVQCPGKPVEAGREAPTPRNRQKLRDPRGKMAPNLMNLYGLGPSIPNPMNSWGLGPSMSPIPINS